MSGAPRTTVLPDLMPFLRRHRSRLLAVLLWATVFVAWQVWSQRQGLTTLAAVQALVALLRDSAWGPVLYVAVYAVRPLLFFPATLLTVAGGFLFGPYLGLLYTIVAGNVSAAVAYLAGRWLGRGLVTDLGPLAPYADRMRQSSFETVLILRLVFAPYDLIGYLAGFLGISFRGFLLGTMLGSLPGSIAVVSFGASIQGDFNGATPSLNPGSLALGGLMLFVSLILSRWMRAREARRTLLSQLPQTPATPTPDP